MPRPNWKDVSTYSQGDKDRTPRSFRLVAGKVVICVSRHIHHPPDVWVLSCDPWYSTLPLVSRDIADAKSEAITMVAAAIMDAMVDLRLEARK